MEKRHEISFKSYDRLFPNQDLVGDILQKVQIIGRNYIMPTDFEIKEMKQFITDRLINKEGINCPDGEEVSDIVNKTIDLNEEFLDMEHFAFSNDDEIKYIQEETGYNFEFIDKVLWERYCFEMKNDYWEYNIDYCIKCGKGPLFFKEIPDMDRGEKIVCKNCHYEMKIGKDGLEPLY